MRVSGNIRHVTAPPPSGKVARERPVLHVRGDVLVSAHPLLHARGAAFVSALPAYHFHLICFSVLRLLAYAVIMIAVSAPIPAQTGEDSYPGWEFLSTTAIGADTFIAAHPEFDGRGTVLAVMDTGVDMGVPGLIELPGGGVKVVEVRDFTGQGDVKLKPGLFEPNNTGEEGGNQYLSVEGSDSKLWGVDRLNLTPLRDGEYLVGRLEEKDSQNSSVPDLNNNGKTNDRFAVIVFETAGDESFWVAYVDTDADGFIDDETPIRDYHVNYDTFHLRGRNQDESHNLLTLALNIDPDKKLVSVHFDDGAHGTHCAGIAAGYRLNGQEGYNGIAPGAQVMSLKIGNNSLSGGASMTDSMKKAFEFGAAYSKEHDVPVVFNLSYGVGSETVGRSEIDQLMEKVLHDNEDNIFLVTSHGNSGPGVNCTGAPGGGAWVFSAGAMLNRSTARDCFGASIPSDQVFAFSSRGGQADKPDAIAPGSASSTVPAWETHDRYSGTSMAAPQVAGAALLLMSAGRGTDPDRPIKGALVHRALKAGAQPLPEYTRLDQGAGVVNVGRSWEVLEDYRSRGKEETILGYDITTFSPSFPDEEGHAGYWRFGTALPETARQQTFNITPRFPEQLDADQRHGFYRAFNLVSSVDWLKPDKSSIYIRGEEAVPLILRIDPRGVSEPGLHVGTVKAFRKGSGRDAAEFTLPVSVITPLTFDAGTGYALHLTGRQGEPGQVDRHFLMVPPGATALRLESGITENRTGNIRLYVYSPSGYRVHRSRHLNSETAHTASVWFADRDTLEPGIWEVDVVTSFSAHEPSWYDLHLVFSGFGVSPSCPWTVTHEAGSNPEGTVLLSSILDTAFEGKASGEVAGIHRQTTLDSSNSVLEHTFRLNSTFSAVRFRITVPPGLFDRFTDLALNVLDSSGEALLQAGLNYPSWEGTFDNPDPGSEKSRSYTLQMVGAFTDSTGGTDWEIDLDEYYQYTQPVAFTLERSGEELFTLYPGLNTELEYRMSGAPQVTPTGFTHYGSITLFDRTTGKTAEQIPVSWVLE